MLRCWPRCGCSLAWEYARVGRLELAQELLDEVAATGSQPPSDPGCWLVTMIHYADVAIACDDHHAAAALYEWLVAYADQFPTDNVVPYAPVDHYLGKLATSLHRYEQAGGHLTGAAKSAGRASATFAAETDLAWAAMFLQRGDARDTQRARAHLDSARSAAVARGYTDIERRTTEILQQLC